MSQLNLEIKAKCHDPRKIKKILKSAGARYIGLDHQTDTYFNYPEGKLKLRKGNIENALIFYERGDIYSPKLSKIELVHMKDKKNTILKRLSDVFGIKIIVKKDRDIYSIGNLRFHIDSVKGLDGYFVEIEATSKNREYHKDILHKQCNYYKNFLGIKDKDLIDKSYSDLLLEKQKSSSERHANLNNF